MKFYSEKLDKLFDSAEELAQAEQMTKSATKKKKTAKVDEAVINDVITEQTQPEVPTRKQLAAEVEAADEALKEAYANYDAAKLKTEELSRKYLEEVNAILDPAQSAVKNAEKKRYEAIRNFNDSFGAYQVTYTGAKAADEMMKAISNINSRANKIFRDMFWL